MTDEQIIKDLKHHTECVECEGCGHEIVGSSDCIDNLILDAISLINRQRAEIERLTEMLNATIAGQETLQKYIAQRSPLEMVGEG